jgi:hypothetical protein
MKVAIVVLTGLAVIASVVLDGPADRRVGTPPPVRQVEVESMYVADFRDARRLVGFADDVFLGHVVARSRTASGTGGDARPRTYYRVQVLERVKGDAAGEIEVAQSGGRDNDGTEVRYSNEPPLEPGRTYFLVTNDSLYGGRKVMPGFGVIPADTDSQVANARSLLRYGAEQAIDPRDPARGGR